MWPVGKLRGWAEERRFKKQLKTFWRSKKEPWQWRPGCEYKDIRYKEAATFLEGDSLRRFMVRKELWKMLDELRDTHAFYWFGDMRQYLEAIHKKREDRSAGLGFDKDAHERREKMLNSLVKKHRQLHAIMEQLGNKPVPLPEWHDNTVLRDKMDFLRREGIGFIEPHIFAIVQHVKDNPLENEMMSELLFRNAITRHMHSSGIIGDESIDEGVERVERALARNKLRGTVHRIGEAQIVEKAISEAPQYKRPNAKEFEQMVHRMEEVKGKIKQYWDVAAAMSLDDAKRLIREQEDKIT